MSKDTKIRNFCFLKTQQRIPQKLEKIFTGHVTNKGLVSGFY